MTERLRKILRGGKLTPVTADEQAVKIAIENAGGGGGITIDDKIERDSVNPVEGGAIYDAFEQVNRNKSLIVHGSVDIVNNTAEITDDISLSDLYSAALRGVFVAFECPLDEGNATRMALAGYTLVGGDYSFTFTAPSAQSNKPAVISASFENSKTGTFEMAVAQ